MRFTTLLILALALVVAGCASQPKATQAYNVRSDGVVSAVPRGAIGGSTDAGEQELLSVYLPFGPLAARGSITYNFSEGPIVIAPPSPFSAAAYGAPCATPTYVHQVAVPQQSVVLPVPRASTPYVVVPSQQYAPALQVAPCQ